jgi:tRNA-Thr(GGU) m(6)t(6)A37 methyltransferase TsaA
MNETILKPIAHIESDFGTKFGIPRQSLIVEELSARIVFEPEYRNPNALRGIETYSHLWLIWQFSENVGADWSPTVRPPRLGGNIRMGVFATRSPFRPNFLGLSCVRLTEVQDDPALGPVLLVSGADLMNGTPIFDIKPYLPYSDCLPEASDGFAPRPDFTLSVVFHEGTEERIPVEKRAALRKVLQCDPRPRYHDDPERVFGMLYAGYDVRFQVREGMLHVLEVTPEI